ncbi:MAG TPA: L-aspartate oxidase [Caulobacteraceae bacterium]
MRASPIRFPRERLAFDGVLVLGAGLAGLSAALASAPRRALLLSSARLGEDCCSAWAQGGMAAALAADDAPALHAADTIAAGAGLCDPSAVEILTREGPDAVRALAELGAPFDRGEAGGFELSLEAAHSRARIARVGGDGAGRAITAAVVAVARASAHITILEAMRGRTLLADAEGRVRGVLVEHHGRWIEILAPATILATGGLGGLYSVTTNPAGARGEGLALAALAGARIVDPEFVQFHPTAMDIGVDPAPLATEALRGEGARLVGRDGEAFMARYHHAGDLAPRDIVARAVEAERRAGRGAFLDARTAIGERFAAAFPAAFAACRAQGIDPRVDLVPVAGAAHYHMGGIETDLRGRTSLEGLLAAGECAAVGVHGANRLASNSLIEAVVFGRRAGEAGREAVDPRTASLPAHPVDDLGAGMMASLRARMSRDAGIVRDAAGLGGLIAWLDAAGARGPALPLVAARLVAEAALARRESRGGHFRSDFPRQGATASHTRTKLPGAGARQSVAA